jgi:O-antigen/teichoic acid export membrane protein
MRGTVLKLGQETFQLTFAQMSGLVVGFAATVLVTRALGAEARGVYSWVLTVHGLAAQLSMLVSYVAVRQLGTRHGEHDWPRLAGTFGVLAFVGWALTLPVFVWAWVQPLGQLHPTLLLLAWLAVPLAGLSTILGALVQLRRRFWDTVNPQLLARLSVLLIAVLFWQTGVLNLRGAVLLTPLMLLVWLAVTLFYLDIPLRRFRPSATLARQLAHFLGASWLAGLALFALPKVALLVLAHSAPLAVTGQYSIAATLTEVALILPNIIGQVLTSHFTSNLSGARARRLTLGLGTGLVALACAAGYLVAIPFIPGVFGPGFAAAVGPFHILLLAVLFNGPAQVWHSQLYAAQRRWGVLLPPLLGLVVCLAAAVWWVPVWGAAGAAWASVAGFAVYALLAGLFTLRLTNPPATAISRPTALSVAE